MNKLYDLYFSLPADSAFGVVSKIVNRVAARLIKKILDKTLPIEYLKSAGGNFKSHDLPKGKRLIASLTSFPGRINEVWISIETILHQSVKPDKVILWLAKDQFPDKVLPKSLVNLFDRGLEVRWCDEDLRSHKKYYYALQEFPNDVIILFDDDLYYPKQLIENVLTIYKSNPGCICATRVHKMIFDDKGLRPYRDWNHNYNPKDNNSKSLFFTSGAGTLIPPGVMPKSTFAKDMFKDICFLADDVWLNMNAIKAGVKIVSNGKYNKDEITIGRSQNEKLVSQNVLFGGNDTQIKAVIEYFKLKMEKANFC